MHMTMEQHIIRIIAVKFPSALVRIFFIPFLSISVCHRPITANHYFLPV